MEQYEDQPSDLELAQMSRENPAAFGLLYRRYIDTVYRYVLVRVPSPEDAEDLTAHIFENALSSLHRFRGDSRFSTWIIQIARHRIADFYRARRHDTLDPAALDEREAPGIAPDDLGLDTVKELLTRLPRAKAEVVELRVFADLSHSEIGEMLGKSEMAIRAVFSRAMKDLRKIIEQEEIYHHEWLS
ncbi:MAG: RNA polymerase sigma factor [Leptospiraceae bacterium]|nr:RNA polymerase sigma factor [Leptospiraceae bacterium]MCB1304014.1 RNA polymerase sigma factor [Leptospiraceae bacterium]